MTTRRRWAAALLAAATGCASPVPRHGVADGAADADAVANDGGEEDRDARVADASGDAGDAADAADASDVVDAGDVAEDAGAADASDVVVASDAADAADAAVFDDVRDAAAEVSVDAGPPTMRLTFVGGALRGSAAGISMRAVIVWHGGIQGRSDDGGITFRGWFR